MLTRRGVPVTLRGLIQRLNRRLKEDHQIVRAARGAQARQDLGDFYRLDYSHNVVLEKDVDVEALARKLHVLAPFEYLRAREG